LGKARVAAACKLAIRLWIMLRDQIDYPEFCRRGQMRQKSGATSARQFHSLEDDREIPISNCSAFSWLLDDLSVAHVCPAAGADTQDDR
jgi:hypothetical protein